MHLSLVTLGPLVLLAHVLGAVAACHAILNTRTSQGAIAWAVSLVAIPYLTLVPYLFLGRSRFSGYVIAKRSNHAQMLRRHGARDGLGKRDGAVSGHQERADALLGADASRALQNLSQRPFVAGNRVRLLIDGEAAFKAIFEAIESACDYVIVQFFIIRDDRLGQRLADLLLARAVAGVRCYVLYDSIGSFDLSRHYISRLKQGGVEVHAFATHRRFVNRFQLNFRNHRKIVVVDGQRAFVGGLNVGVEYLGEKPPLSPWRDTHVEVIGPAVTELQAVFAEDWHWATQAVPHLADAHADSGADMHCHVIASGPADQRETCSLYFVTAINAARQRVWITSPYLVPDEAVFTALRLAVMRGVEVRLLIPSRPDHKVVFAASTLYAHDLQEAGVAVYRYQPGFVHQKVLLIDDCAASVGSANLDNRSFRLNFEITLLTVDRDFATEVASMLQHDFSNAVKIGATDFLDQSRWRRVAMQVARLFAPIL